MDIVNNFFSQIVKNLESDNLFIKQKNFFYKDIKIFYKNFDDFFQKKKKNLRIATISQKSFSLYSSIISILLSKNIWVPLDNNLPSI